MEKEEKKAEGKLVKGGYASFNEYGELIEGGTLRPRDYDYKRVKGRGGYTLKAVKSKK